MSDRLHVGERRNTHKWIFAARPEAEALPAIVNCPVGTYKDSLLSFVPHMAER